MIVSFLVVGIAQLNAQTTILMHSYDFETDMLDGTGAAHGTAFGSAAVSGGSLVLANDGDYISFDGAALGLTAYSSITLEFVYQSNNDYNNWNWSYYFGDNDGENSVRGGFYTWSQLVGIAGTSEGWYPTSEDGSWHHYVQVITSESMDMYKDGELLGSSPSSELTVGSLENYIGKGADAWPDPTWMGLVDEFNIYEGAMDATTVAERASAYLDGSNASLATITVSAGTLAPAFDPSIISYGVSVPAGTASVDVDATTQVAEATILSGTGTIAIVDGFGTTDIVVQAIDGVTTKTYTVTFKEECFEPLFPEGNLINDPTITDINNFSGWGYYAINADPEFTYCGATSGIVGDNCGGSLNYILNGLVEPGKTYRVRAVVYVDTAQFKIGIYNAGSTSPFEFPTSVTQEWEVMDFFLTLADDITQNDIGLYFNSCEGLGGLGGYIDNWEMYEVAVTNDATLSDISVSAGILDPSFSSSTTSYDVELPAGTTTININATASSSAATFTINGTAAANGEDVAIDIVDHSGVATIVVTAEDGTTQLTYTVNFTTLGIGEYDRTNGLNVFVNGENLEVSMKTPVDATVDVYAISGQKIATATMSNQNNATVQIPEYTGTAIVTVTTNEYTSVRKVVIF